MTDMQPIIHPSGALGIPSGWEECAACIDTAGEVWPDMVNWPCRRFREVWQYMEQPTFKYDWRILP